MSTNEHEDWLDRVRAKRKNLSPQGLFEKLRTGDRIALAEGITLVESRKLEDQELAHELIEKCLSFSGKSIRIGITGVPGVGKSTFIEAFGLELIKRNAKIAVLAIDPTSAFSKGSILGDKTRMEELSIAEGVFIRPSPAGDSLGGVARRTREAIILCEVAGFDHILVETVGVGQSETAVNSMVDFFVLLMLAGAGDELQGIKKGIMEMADAVVITKADGENVKKANLAAAEYKSALHLFQANANSWIPRVLTCSAIENYGITEIIDVVEEFQRQQLLSGWFEKNRTDQDVAWLTQSLNELLLEDFYSNKVCSESLEKLKSEVAAKQKTSFRGAEELFRLYKGK